MNKKRFHTIIFLMALSLVGLLSLQAFWIHQTLQANKEQLKRQTYQALHAVNTRLEQEQVLRTTHQFFVKNNKEKGVTSFDFFHLEERLKGEAATQDTLQGRIYLDHQVFATDPLALQDYIPNELKVQRRLPRKEIEIKLFDRQITDSILSVRKQLKNHLQQANDEYYLIESVLSELKRPEAIKERIQPQLLATFLREELRQQGITTDYVYGVLNMDSTKVALASQEQVAFQTLYQGYKTTLFTKSLQASPLYLAIYYPNQEGYIWEKAATVLGSSAVLTSIILVCFYLSIRTILHQKKLSEIKNDFISNVTHELKTPIATISLACEALLDQEVPTQALLHRYLRVIADENTRLSKQVEKILQIAALDKHSFELKLEPVDVNQLVQQVGEHLRIQIENKAGTLQYDLRAPEAMLQADHYHLTNVIYNLIDNANKYSPEQPHITVCTEDRPEGLALIVQDQGVGIQKEHLKQVFDKFYRVPTGNLHNVQGFGLGLSYVKKIVEAHQGTIEAKSE
ncbi:MAG: HAMP domain-containing sensor histidine kinase, partial [Bacteroidota bacterium]